MKKIIIILSMLSVFFITGCNSETVINPPEGNKSYSTFNETVVNDVIIRNHNVAYYDNIYHVYLDIFNENNVDVYYSSLTIRYYNNTALIYSTTQDIAQIKAHDSINVSFEIDINLVNANRVEYTIE